MSTKTDFYLGRGHDAEWLGSLQGEYEPDNLLRIPPGRLALTATDEPIYRAAIADLLITWETEALGAAYPRRTGWPWPWPTSHVSDWIVTFDPAAGGVFVTIGGGVRWERIDPRNPHAPHGNGIGPPDLEAWLHAPADPPSVPLPLMRHPATDYRPPGEASPPARHPRRTPMTAHNPPAIETVTRRFTENGCEVTAIIADPADAQQTLHGTVTRDGVLVGSYYCANQVRQSDWRIVTADGHHLTLDGRPVNPVSDGAAVLVLTTILTAPPHEIDQRLRDAINPPQ